MSEMNLARRSKRKWFLVVGVFAVAFVFAFLVAKNNNETMAANMGAFDPGYIMSDWQMSNYISMDESAIQAFLKSKNSCYDTNLNKYTTGNKVGYFSEMSPPRTWHIKDGHFVCMADEVFDGGTAAHIIWQAAQDYRINPQVLLVLLEKEQSLVTDTFPHSQQYRSATGYGCPDTAPCSSQYYGLKNQIRKAAELFRTVLDGGWTNYPLGWNYVQYNPNAGCGGTMVNIRSLATSALYRYTPYQPNAAALGGWNDGCGAYGNMNFYKLFEDWFGGITNNTVSMDKMVSPRIMTISQSTLLINAERMETTSTWLNKNENYQFTRKTTIFWGGERRTCLQRKEDEGTSYCVLMSRTNEFSLKDAINPFADKREFEVINLTCEISIPSFETNCGNGMKNKGQTLYSSGVVIVSGKKYNVVNDGKNLIYSVRMRRRIYYETIGPVVMKLSKNSFKYSVDEGRVQTLNTNQYAYIMIMDKTSVDGSDYYRTVVDYNNDNNYLIPVDAMSNAIFVDFLFPRNMATNRDASFVDLNSGKVCSSVKKGNIKRYKKKITLGGLTYFQDEDSQGTNCVIESTYLEETEYNYNYPGNLQKFTAFIIPRNLRTKEGTYAMNVESGVTCDRFLEKNNITKYETKIIVNGTFFYRSEADTWNNSPCAVPANNLSEI